MLQSMGSRRVRLDLATEKQQLRRKISQTRGMVAGIRGVRGGGCDFSFYLFS